MSGGSAKSSGKTPADEPPDEPKHATCLKKFLIAGFMHFLLQAFPDRYKGLADDEMIVQGNVISLHKQPKLLALDPQQIIADIQHVTGYKLCVVLNDELTTYQEMKKAHDDFGKKHNMPNNRIITGAYVTESGEIALQYAQPDVKLRQYILVGFSHLGFMKGENQIPVGSQGQTDFGVRPDGTPHMTLRSKDWLYYCLKHKDAFHSFGILGFDIPEQPSDFALEHNRYNPDAWKIMKKRFPGLKEHKQNLVAARKKQIRKESAKKRKAVRTKAWTAKVGTRPKSSHTGKGS
jgi:hypothetical protein